MSLLIFSFSFKLVIKYFLPRENLNFSTLLLSLKPSKNLLLLFIFTSLEKHIVAPFLFSEWKDIKEEFFLRIISFWLGVFFGWKNIYIFLMRRFFLMRKTKTEQFSWIFFTKIIYKEIMFFFLKSLLNNLLRLLLDIQ